MDEEQKDLSQAAMFNNKLIKAWNAQALFCCSTPRRLRIPSGLNTKWTRPTGYCCLVAAAVLQKPERSQKGTEV